MLYHLFMVGSKSAMSSAAGLFSLLFHGWILIQADNLHTGWDRVVDRLYDEPLPAELVPYRDASLTDKLDAVEDFTERFAWVDDVVNWGVSDYWANPSEFMDRSGDCEDYAIFEYAMLRKLGVESSKMKILVVYDQVRNIGHAILLVESGESYRVLDSLDNPLSRYVPRYAVSEDGSWVAIPSNM